MSLQKNNRQRGKAHQSKTADAFGGLNVGTLGGEDVHHSKFSIECKSTQKFVGEKWYEQACKNNKFDRIPIVVVHIKGKRYEEDYVIIKRKDFLKLK